MANFLQLHMLTSYGPSCLNRDDTGRPKTATMGGVERLRVSSQCLKRAWRTSDVFANTVGNHLGIRTRRIGDLVIEHLTETFDEQKAKEAAKKITKLFTSGDDVIFLFSRREFERAMDAAERYASGELTTITHDDVLLREDTDVDVAMFGRMLAAKPEHNREAATQVSHAITTHRVTVEDDYFSAVDDRADVASEQGSGAGHINSRQFGAGTFYTYTCVDRDLLKSNLPDSELANAALEALVRAASTVSPSGMQASFASRSVASYVLAETGDQQPRSLVSAFTKPVRGENQVAESVTALERYREALDSAYGRSWDTDAVLDVSSDTRRGSLADIIALARG